MKSNARLTKTRDEWLTTQVDQKSKALKGRLALLRQGKALNTRQVGYDRAVFNYLADHADFIVNLKFNGSLLYPYQNGRHYL